MPTIQQQSNLNKLYNINTNESLNFTAPLLDVSKYNIKALFAISTPLREGVKHYKDVLMLQLNALSILNTRWERCEFMDLQLRYDSRCLLSKVSFCLIDTLGLVEYTRPMPMGEYEHRIS